MNIASLDAEAYQLTPRAVLRRASSGEVALIKARLAAFSSPLGVLSGILTWEGNLSAPPGPVDRLPPADWRYFVVRFEGPNDEIVELENVASLAPVELEIGFTMIDNPGGTLWHPDRLFHTLEEARLDSTFFRKITTQDVEELKSLYARFRNSGSEHHQIVSQLLGLKGLPHRSPLCFLGYFALLESVLTHIPKPEDRYDSITRQVKKKLALLDARWERKIDYRPFMGAHPEKVWSRMYDYRSAVAHGGTPDFAGDLKLLRGPVEALNLIKETTKAVIRQALIEPQLLRDLREC